MKPIKVKYRDDKRREVWALWIDSVGHDSIKAILVPIGIDNPKPLAIELSQIQVISAQNDHLSLEEPKA